MPEQHRYEKLAEVVEIIFVLGVAVLALCLFLNFKQPGFFSSFSWEKLGLFVLVLVGGFVGMVGWGVFRQETAKWDYNSTQRAKEREKEYKILNPNGENEGIKAIFDHFSGKENPNIKIIHDKKQK